MKSIFTLLFLAFLFLGFEAKAQYNPYPLTNPNSCAADLRDEYGYTVQSFLGRGYRACDDALYNCDMALRNFQRYGQYRYARCILRNHGVPRNVTRSCNANMILRGRVVQVVTAQATGPMRSNVQQMACRKALAKCQSMSQRQRYYGATCTLSQHGGVIRY